MAKYILTNQAVKDLTNIWNYTFDTWSERQANKYYKMLIESCQEIAKRPDIGKNYEEIAERLFGYKTGRHIIFYITKNVNEVLIIRILHEQMDIKNRIKE